MMTLKKNELKGTESYIYSCISDANKKRITDSEFYDLCYMVDTLYDGHYYQVEDLISAYFIYYDIKNQCSREQFYKIIQDRIITELYL